MKLLARTLLTVLALAPAALAADPWSHAQVVTEIMVDNSFQPDHLTFHSGQPYELRLENHGKDMHEFTAPAFFRTATVRDTRVLVNGGTDVVVQPGQSVSIFLIPGTKGGYDLACADHDWDGMVGRITVD
jgi:uncharacterized cupredoxin-like copper-binding protein